MPTRVTLAGGFVLGFALLVVCGQGCKVKREDPGGASEVRNPAGGPAGETRGGKDAEAIARAPKDPLVDRIASIAPGDKRCPHGGVLMTRFKDADANGKYDFAKDTDLGESVACAAPTARPVIRHVSIAPGDPRCATGGTFLESFVDVDGDGAFDASKDSSPQSSVVCNGTKGADGKEGGKGTTGAAGADGVSLAVRAIPTGSAGCPAGGFEVTEYVDLDGSRSYSVSLDSFLRAEKICLKPQVAFETKDLPVADETCPAGGVEVRTWFDKDADGVFDAGEESLEATRKVCHGVKGESGYNAVVHVEELRPGGPTCANGGVRVTTFTDVDGNNVFGPPDLNKGVRDVCHGAHAMWVTQNIPVGDSRCADGGVQFKPFVDLNNSRALDSGDLLLAEHRLCNGRNIAGYNGVVAQKAILAGDADCPAGGYLLESSSDVNKNGKPDPFDYNYMVRKVCDANGQSQGQNGANATPAPTSAPGSDPGGQVVQVLNIAPEDATCFLGGKATRSAVDVDGDGLPEESDIDFHETIECDGADGVEPVVLVKSMPPGSPVQGQGSAPAPGCALLEFQKAPQGNTQVQGSTLDGAVALCEQAPAFPRADIPAPPPGVLKGRFLHSAVFAAYEAPQSGGTQQSQDQQGQTQQGPTTTKKLLVWGGRDFAPNPALNDGASYDIVTGQWSALSKANAPSARFGHIGVWTGSLMLIFGGTDAGGTPQWSGKRYDPSTDTWTSMSTPPADSNNRFNFSWTWTGGELVVWGGSRYVEGGSERNDGLAYDPAKDKWRKLVPPPVGAPTPFPTVGEPASSPIQAPPLPAARHWAPLGFCDGQLALMGGRSTSRNSAELVTKYNPQGSTFTYADASGHWTKKTDFPSAMVSVANAGEACLAGEWIVQGGVRGNPGDPASWFGLTSPWLYRYLMSGNAWSDRVPKPPHLVGNGPTFADPAGGRVMMTLANTPFSAPSRMASYSPSGKSWTVSGALPPGDSRIGASTLWAEGKMWVWGGLDHNNTATSSGFTMGP